MSNSLSKTKKKAILIGAILFIILLAIIHLFWLALTLIIFLLIYLGKSLLIHKIKDRATAKIINTIANFLLFFFIFISLKIVVFGIFKIPSSSMENQLFKGDVILVNKLNYGPRLPQSPFDIPWINIAFYFNTNARKRIKENWWSYKRLSGTTTIKQGDVMVFNSNWDKNYILVKRCMALPGDTLQIKNNQIYTNRQLFAAPNSVKVNPYFQYEPTKKLFFDQWEDWNFNNMGPFVMPQKGMTIPLNTKNFKLYKKAIRMGEKKHIYSHKGEIYIDKNKITSYTFTKDYYFMMGDNRDFTEDSRIWGLVPKQNIIGKVNRVLFSNHNDVFNWERLFKKVY